MTHASIQAGALSVAVAASVAMLVKGCSAEEVRQKLPTIVAQQEKTWYLGHQTWEINRDDYHSVSKVLRDVFEDCDLYDLYAVRDYILENAKTQLKPVKKAHVNGGYVLLGGVHAVIMALLPDIDPRTTLSDLIRLGNDTDTVGAIAGSILGARFGITWIPVETIKDHKRVLAYANALVSLQLAELESKDEFFKREAELSFEGRQFHQKIMQEYFPKPE